jgi:hypothetical protein
VHTENLKWHYLAEFALTLPSVESLWELLTLLNQETKSNTISKISTDDLRRLLVAILELPVP